MNLLFGGTHVVASSDTATSPEAVAYAPAAGVPAGVYNVQVCPFDDPDRAVHPPGNYVGTFTAERGRRRQPVPYPPSWNVLPGQPAAELRPGDHDATTARIGCWVSTVDGAPVPGCRTRPHP